MSGYRAIYPAHFDTQLSEVNEAEVVFTSYAFSRKIQQYLLDYCFKAYSGIPLSDEITEDPYSDEGNE